MQWTFLLGLLAFANALPGQIQPRMDKQSLKFPSISRISGVSSSAAAALSNSPQSPDVAAQHISDYPVAAAASTHRTLHPSLARYIEPTPQEIEANPWMFNAYKDAPKVEHFQRPLAPFSNTKSISVIVNSTDLAHAYPFELVVSKSLYSLDPVKFKVHRPIIVFRDPANMAALSVEKCFRLLGERFGGSAIYTIHVSSGRIGGERWTRCVASPVKADRSSLTSKDPRASESHLYVAQLADPAYEGLICGNQREGCSVQ